MKYKYRPSGYSMPCKKVPPSCSRVLEVVLNTKLTLFARPCLVHYRFLHNSIVSQWV